MGSMKRIPELDGVRAMALVIGCHYRGTRPTRSRFVLRSAAWRPAALRWYVSNKTVTKAGRFGFSLGAYSAEIVFCRYRSRELA